MKRWLRSFWTAHRLRILIAYGWCPACNSSPPREDCGVCSGSYNYGPTMLDNQRAIWAGRYIRERG